MAGKAVRSTKSERTRQHIMDTYVAMMAVKSWDKITISEVCHKAEITRGTFYQYFEDLLDLIDQVESLLIDRLTKCYLETDTVTHPKDYDINGVPMHFSIDPPGLMTVWFDFYTEHKMYLANLLSHNGNPYFARRIKQLISDHMQIMMDADGMPQDERRVNFTKIVTELYFMAASAFSDILPREDVMSLLNTIRIGAKFDSHINNN